MRQLISHNLASWPGLRWAPFAVAIQHPLSAVLSRFPLVILVVLAVAKAEEYPKIREIIGAAGRQAIAWNSTLIVAGSTAIFASWLIYALFCSEIIKRHTAVETYLQEQNSTGNHDFQLARKNLLQHIEKGDAITSDIAWLPGTPHTLTKNANAKHVKLSLQPPFTDNFAVAKAHWHLMDGSPAAMIGVAWFLLILGSATAGWPTITTTWRALQWLLVEQRSTAMSPLVDLAAS